MKYYFLIDNSTQWFSKIVLVDDKDIIVEQIPYPSDLHSDFVSKNILTREHHFTNKQFFISEGVADSSNRYYGWTISYVEYRRIKDLITLHPQYLEYKKLL